MVSTNLVFSGFSFIGFILVIVLLPLHIKARNIGKCSFIIWTSLLCFNGFINSIIWNDNVTNWAPVWCDISSRLIIAGPVGVNSAYLCIARRLYLVISVVMHDQSESRVPYIVQFERFRILETIGCLPALEKTQLLFPVLIGPLAVVTVAIAVYARWAQLNEHFVRLLALVLVMVVCSVTPGVWTIVFSATDGTMTPWPGWDYVHANISQISQHTTHGWQTLGPGYVVHVELQRWVFVVYAIIFFALFGFTTGAKKSYSLLFNFMAGRPRELEVSGAPEASTLRTC
ncbi:hypothetical protein SERLADRAFT_447320 [Serpula lacrymans var. lacrymans S7.9]|uniref:Fungal pheromone STE3G-protein-coupled receptor n=1 Tax=Serpula lacrymans var. lacrymans (strain S7.9) TaxID=578457 RepID=F8NPC5_SERL9|nr:uncharacterized protein SERLADRAFT_447320 [Serpula lacrymans var. lacrymans S7.9]EGO28117.1 hypothetical protein SERLADRAFT_447320 [Serpula lacrymans var. lacrymans S7.9]